MTRNFQDFFVFIFIFISLGVNSEIKANDLISELDSPEVKLKDAHLAFTGVVQMDENMTFLRTTRAILHTLNEIHLISKTQENTNLDALIQRGKLRRLMNIASGVSCLIPFNFAGAQVSTKEIGYLGNFIATLDSINSTYRTRYQTDLGFEIAVFGYTDHSGSNSQNQILAHARARNSAKILSALASERNLSLKIVTIEGYPDQNPYGENACHEDDASCRVCKIMLTRLTN